MHRHLIRHRHRRRRRHRIPLLQPDRLKTIPHSPHRRRLRVPRRLPSHRRIRPRMTPAHHRNRPIAARINQIPAHHIARPVVPGIPRRLRRRQRTHRRRRRHTRRMRIHKTHRPLKLRTRPPVPIRHVPTHTRSPKRVPPRRIQPADHPRRTRRRPQLHSLPSHTPPFNLPGKHHRRRRPRIRHPHRRRTHRPAVTDRQHHRQHLPARHPPHRPARIRKHSPGRRIHPSPTPRNLIVERRPLQKLPSHPAGKCQHSTQQQPQSPKCKSDSLHNTNHTRLTPTPPHQVSHLPLDPEQPRPSICPPTPNARGAFNRPSASRSHS